MQKIIRMLAAVILMIAMLSSHSLAQGEAGASSLIIPPGARANAMGQCYVAVSDDATGIWWNPAGLAVQNRTVDLMHSQLVPDLASDVFYEYIAGVYKLEGIAVVGFALHYLTYGTWTHTKMSSKEEGEASSWEIAPAVSGAVKLTDSFFLGMNLKFIYVSLAPDWTTIEGMDGTGHSVAVDFGAIWRVPDFGLAGYRISRLYLGLSVTNLGPSITYINRDQAADLPRNLRVGFAYTPVSDELSEFTLMSEVNRPLVEFDRSNTYHAGAEYVYARLLALRAGYVHDRDGNIMDPTYGLGFIINDRVRIDYASVPQAKELGRVHRWSLGLTF
ncbi:MAG: PorV/PorQ family protein [Candidatus Krumholzibacteriota bacterium]|nr:PorV/PorQ family protein [Candidatus Krumholzibacteriota bacterium]